MYLLGHGISKDYQKALVLFRLAADQGNPLAQVKLGIMYEIGEGVPQDFVQAHKWHNLGGANGGELGVKHRDDLAKQMTSAQITEAQQLARDWRPKGK